MNVKTYEAPTIQAALALVKEDLGPNAFVLGAERKTKKGLFGMGAKEVCEIRAASDAAFDGEPLALAARASPGAAAKAPALPKRDPSPAIVAGKQAPALGSMLLDDELMEDYRDLASYLPYGKHSKSEISKEALAERLNRAEVEKAKSSHREWTRSLETRGTATKKASAISSALPQLQAEILQLASTISSLASSQQVAQAFSLRAPGEACLASDPENLRQAEGAQAEGLCHAGLSVPEESCVANEAEELKQETEDAQAEGLCHITNTYVEEAVERLRSAGLDPMLQTLLTKPLSGAAADMNSLESVREQAQRRLARLLKIAEPDEIFTSGAKAVALIGPTGVGKTTTLAKLAARALLQYRRTVVLVTLDMYRIGAIKQLSTYADIINVPLKVAKTPADLDAVISESPSNALILIDTAGRNPFRLGDLGGLTSYFRNAPRIQKHLLLSSTTSEADNLQFAASFESFGVTHVVMTKIDETQRHGAMVNVLARAAKPLAYLTNGQNVPEDIEAGNPETIANLLFGHLQPQGE